MARVRVVLAGGGAKFQRDDEYYADHYTQEALGVPAFIALFNVQKGVHPTGQKQEPEWRFHLSHYPIIVSLVLSQQLASSPKSEIFRDSSNPFGSNESQ